MHYVFDVDGKRLEARSKRLDGELPIATFRRDDQGGISDIRVLVSSAMPVDILRLSLALEHWDFNDLEPFTYH